MGLGRWQEDREHLLAAFGGFEGGKRRRVDGTGLPCSRNTGAETCETRIAPAQIGASLAKAA